MQQIHFLPTANMEFYIFHVHSLYNMFNWTHQIQTIISLEHSCDRYLLKLKDNIFTKRIFIDDFSSTQSGYEN